MNNNEVKEVMIEMELSDSSYLALKESDLDISEMSDK